MMLIKSLSSKSSDGHGSIVELKTAQTLIGRGFNKIEIYLFDA